MKSNLKVDIFCLFGISLLALGILPGCSKHKDNGTAQTQQAIKYHCPMHPNYISDKPGDCPICHMKLVPMEQPTEGEKKIIYYRNPMNPKITSQVPMKDGMGMDYVPVYEETDASETKVTGQGTVKMTESSRQLIGVETATVTVRPLARDLRASAQVAYDPELYNTIREYQEIQKNTKAGEFQSVRRAAELKLEQMGISGELLKQVGNSKFDGGFLLTAGAGKKIWVYADIYADEAAWVKPGQQVALTASAFPGRSWKGKVLSIDRVINKDTRTLRARVETVNTDGYLRPEMFLNAVIKADLGTRLAVLNSALLQTGTRTLAYVEINPGEFEPREVVTGAEAEDYTEVMTGLKEGDRVVVSANFLIDSESKIKGAR